MIDPDRAEPVASEPRPSLWRNRDFALLWCGQLVSYLGTKVSSIALPLLVLAVTNSPAQAGFITSARMLPYLLFGLPAGALIDRWNRKTVMVVCDVVRAVALGSVPIAWSLAELTLPHLYAVAFVQGTAFVFFNVAEISALPRVVSPETLPQATALDSTAGSIGSLVGPGLGGFIISLSRSTAAGAAVAYLVDAITFLLSLISLRFIRAEFQAERPAENEVVVRGVLARIHNEVMEGVRFVWSDARLRVLVLLSGALGFLYAPVSLAMIVLLRNEMRVNAGAIGLVFSVAAVGGLIGSIVAPALKRRLSVGTMVLLSVLVQALATVPVGLATSAAVMAVAWAVVFACDPVFFTASATFRMSVTPDRLQGRMNSVFRMVAYGVEPLGAALGGVFLGVVGARAEIVGVAVAVGICAAATAVSRLRFT